MYVCIYIYIYIYTYVAVAGSGRNVQPLVIVSCVSFVCSRLPTCAPLLYAVLCLRPVDAVCS